VEALACPIEHVGLIKFWAMNSKTMEAYTLWWNGGSFRSFMRINSKVSPAEDYEKILNHPTHTMQELEMIKAYCIKAAKLAMSLTITMARVHKSKILHNDISPSNILFHFPPDHVDRVYIGVCDWSMATASLRKFPQCMVIQQRLKWRRIRRSAIGWPQSYFMFTVHPIPRQQ
jgi:serine/threonine protein kinase